MQLTYILVDFENVQPQDLALLHGQQYRVKVFHGPHQNKLEMAIIKALQPLGGQVEYLQSEKPGKNALDFHVAFCIGRLVQEHQSKGIPARFGIVSRDGGFDSLLRHVRALGYPAQQAETIREALNFASDEDARPTPATIHALPAARKAPSPPTLTTTEEVDKVIAGLRKNANNRPTKRIALERHIPSLLGGQRSPATVQAIVAELERRGAVEFSEKAIKYKIPAAKT